MSTIHTILPVDDYARASDRFVTSAYYSGQWHTILYVVDIDVGARRPVPSTDKRHPNERDARSAAVVATYGDNGRGCEPWTDQVLRFAMGG